jgi:RNA polymerase sigma-70 factor (ECF subfamily)
MMAVGHNRLANRDLQILFSDGALGGLPDGPLLERYVCRRDEAVFEAIVRRHGPMVWGVCRRVLGDHHDAEDAFQATFLVLARKASSVVPREMLPNWLYGVACQTAMRARAGIFKRRGRERQVPEMPEPAADPRESWGGEALALLDEELGRLPEHYRAPIVLCDLEGRTHRQAAEQLGWPVGTVAGRLSRARALLAGRLARRGVALPAATLAVLLSQQAASAGMPVSLIASTARAASVFAAGQGAAGAVVSARAADLTEGVLKTMLLTKLKIATAVLVGLVALAAGASSGGSDRRAEASSPARGDRGVRAGSAETRGDAAGRKALGPREEMKRLEGIWAITALAEGAEQASPQDAAQNGDGMGRVVIRGDRMTIKTHVKGSRSNNTFKFWVDPTRSPRNIAMVRASEKSEDQDDLPILLGIYELEGDTMRICLGVDRPDKFEWGPNDNRMMMVLKWAFPPESP